MHKFTLMIDTDSYAGNFERELAAWLTGKRQKGLMRDIEYMIAYANLGIYSFGRKDYSTELDFDLGEVIPWINKHTVYVTEAGKEGYENVCKIFRSPNNSEFNTVGIYFSERPTDDVMKYIKARTEGFTVARRAVNEFLTGRREGKRIKFLDYRIEELSN